MWRRSNPLKVNVTPLNIDDVKRQTVRKGCEKYHWRFTGGEQASNFVCISACQSGGRGAGQTDKTFISFFSRISYGTGSFDMPMSFWPETPNSSGVRNLVSSIA
jgi:hypothetical protein